MRYEQAHSKKMALIPHQGLPMKESCLGSL